MLKLFNEINMYVKTHPISCHYNVLNFVFLYVLINYEKIVMPTKFVIIQIIL
jgi:hypothetical protein